MKNAIFTICAKNYLAQAKTLGASIKMFAPDVDFSILLSDEIDEQDIQCSEFMVLEAKNFNIPNYYNMAFKYDVIEFSTSIKPFYIDYLINIKDYEKVIYIDPDMVVYSSLDFLFNELDQYDALLTPHILKPYIKYEGATSEEELLFVGIYNLGFFAINNSETSRQIIEWWKVKLEHQCYADKEDALHVDQKWMDFLPALYGERVKILRHPGLNVAFWNMHERHFEDQGNSYIVDSEKLVIFHFSGLDPHDYSNIARKQDKYNLSSHPQYKRIFEEYVEALKRNGFSHLFSLKYSYNYYDNGIHILKYQRRLFRSIAENGDNIYQNPFSTNNGSFYHFLVQQKLMIFDKEGKFHALRKGINNIDTQVGRMFKLLKLFKHIVGIRRYYLLMRFISSYHRFEKQTFLFKK